MVLPKKTKINKSTKKQIVEKQEAEQSLLKKIRNENGLTQKQFAKKLKVDQSFISYIERGKLKINMELALALHKIFNTDYSTIMEAYKESKDARNKQTKRKGNKLAA